MPRELPPELRDIFLRIESGWEPESNDVYEHTWDFTGITTRRLQAEDNEMATWTQGATDQDLYHGDERWRPLPEIFVPTGGELLADSPTWINRFSVPSSDGSKEYVISNTVRDGFGDVRVVGVFPTNTASISRFWDCLRTKNHTRRE